MARYIDEAITRYVAEQGYATADGWFLVVAVERLNGERTLLRLAPAGQPSQETGGLILHASIKHDQYVRGLGQ
jgi:hypothetical protein